MKKFFTGAILSLFIISSSLILIPKQAEASGLTNSQVQAILSLLSAFGANLSVINNVNAALSGKPISNTAAAANSTWVTPSGAVIDSSGNVITPAPQTIVTQPVAAPSPQVVTPTPHAVPNQQLISLEQQFLSEVPATKTACANAYSGTTDANNCEAAVTTLGNTVQLETLIGLPVSNAETQLVNVQNIYTELQQEVSAIGHTAIPIEFMKAQAGILTPLMGQLSGIEAVL